MQTFRISRWVEPECPASRLSVNKALTAMSVTWVTHAWLQRELRLSARKVDSWLRSLHDQGALMRCGEGGPRRSSWSAKKANLVRMVRGDPIVWLAAL
jgi:hypothetical protein